MNSGLERGESGIQKPGEKNKPLAKMGRAVKLKICNKLKLCVETPLFIQ